jgi:beta-galactosidase
VTDEINFIYQTETWGAPTELKLIEKSRSSDTVTVEAKLYDSKGVLCLDARNQVHFSVAGSGKLTDNLGTARGSRVVQLYNGRAEITLTPNDGGSVVAVAASGLSTAFCTVA